MSDLVEGAVALSVPATSANLGPGFDALGLALGLRDHLEARVLVPGDPDDSVVDVVGEGETTLARDGRHLVLRTLRAGLEAMGVRAPAVHLRCRNVIPHARGLGSSSAAIVGGLGLARALVVDGAERLDDAALLSLAATLEGHPDNVAPALLGGFVVAGHDDGAWWAVPASLDARISAVVLVPPEAVETEVARGLLPAQVSHADAAAGAGRSALLVAALAGQVEQLHRGTRDHLHQEHRRPAMPDTLALIDALRADGVAATVSGAGPTVLALVVSDADARAVLARVPRGWRAERLAVEAEGLRTEPAAVLR